MFGLSTLVTRIIAGLAVVLLVVGLLYLHSCQKARTAATEAKLQRNQSNATLESAKDAIATQGEVAKNEAASADLTRNNEKEIRDAKGADAAVDPAVRDAGLASLCRRPSYRTSERCVRFNSSR